MRLNWAPGDIAISTGMLGYFSAAWIFCMHAGMPNDFAPFIYVKPFYLSYLLYSGTFFVILKLRARRASHSTFFGTSLTLSPADFLRRVVAALPIPLASPFFMAGFTSIKNLLDDTIPFTWDERLSALDRSLHLGHQPWEWLSIGIWPLTRALECIYAFWGVAFVAVPFAVCLQRSGSPNRTRFLISYHVTIVVLGSLVASLFMSAGPFWFQHQSGIANDYAGLFAYLDHGNRSRAFSAVLFQDYLWLAHQKNITEIGTAISAFPSIHVAIASLFAFYAWPIGRSVRPIGVTFLALIVVGSIHLGWHYAVDGYAGFAGAATIYWVVGRLLRHSPPEVTVLPPPS